MTIANKTPISFDVGVFLLYANEIKLRRMLLRMFHCNVTF